MTGRLDQAEGDAQETERFKRVENWRERLITQGAPALLELQHWRPDIDAAEWAQRVHTAQAERERSGVRGERKPRAVGRARSESLTRSDQWWSSSRATPAARQRSCQ